MPNTTIILGSLLILIGLIGYGYGWTMTEHASPTALIPAALGIVMMVLGFVAKANEGLRKHLMHAAVLVALVGFVMTAWRLLKMSEFVVSAALISQLATALVCLLIVILAVRSFVAARGKN